MGGECSTGKRLTRQDKVRLHVQIDKLSYRFNFMRAIHVINYLQHYYYSYILDDESRSVIGNNHESTPFGPVPQLFSVRLHIGNETLARDGFTSVVVACQPAPSKQFQDENIENGQFLNCNSTSPSSGVSVVVRKHYDASRESNSGNQTTLTIQFAQTSHACTFFK